MVVLFFVMCYYNYREYYFSAGHEMRVINTCHYKYFPQDMKCGL